MLEGLIVWGVYLVSSSPLQAKLRVKFLQKAHTPNGGKVILTSFSRQLDVRIKLLFWEGNALQHTRFILSQLTYHRARTTTRPVIYGCTEQL